MSRPALQNTPIATFRAALGSSLRQDRHWRPATLEEPGYISTVMILFCALLIILCGSIAHGQPIPAGRVIDEINLARTAPRTYAAFLRAFRSGFQGNHYTFSGSGTAIMTVEGVAAVDEAIRFLVRQKPLPPLEWSKGLSAAAAELAGEQDRTGAVGHVGRKSGGMRERVERHGIWMGKIGEVISYGPDEPRRVVMQLIIDDGVRGRGHRKNIFTPSFRKGGAACAPHPSFRAVCVTDFADGFRE